MTLTQPAVFDDVNVGSSIAVNGVCLTVTLLNNNCMQFHMVPETVERTNLSQLTLGEAVNVERAVRADARLDGHIVQGHVEGVAKVISFVDEGEGKRLTVQIPQELIKNVIQKGSIALNGVSLTVVSLEGNTCSVALVPHTLKETTFASCEPGDFLNIETDVLSRYAIAKKE